MPKRRRSRMAAAGANIGAHRCRILKPARSSARQRRQSYRHRARAVVNETRETHLLLEIIGYSSSNERYRARRRWPWRDLAAKSGISSTVVLRVENK